VSPTPEGKRNIEDQLTSERVRTKFLAAYYDLAIVINEGGENLNYSCSPCELSSRKEALHLMSG
jgi:hypothetical protein